jgi:hypothetical protein
MSENQLPEGAVPLDAVMPAQPSYEIQLAPYEANKVVTVELSDGRKVRLAKPTASPRRIELRILSGLELPPLQFELEKKRVRSLLYVSHINGNQVTRPVDMITFQALEEQIGDEFLDTIFTQYVLNFPDQDSTTAADVKK